MIPSLKATSKPYPHSTPILFLVAFRIVCHDLDIDILFTVSPIGHMFLSILFTTGPPAARPVPGTKQGSINIWRRTKDKWLPSPQAPGVGACTSVTHRQAPLPAEPVDTRLSLIKI